MLKNGSRICLWKIVFFLFFSFKLRYVFIQTFVRAQNQIEISKYDCFAFTISIKFLSFFLILYFIVTIEKVFDQFFFSIFPL